MDKEKKPKVFQIILASVCSIFTVFAYIPKGLSIAQIISAGFIFLVIIYFVIRAFKYFKIY
tara:strand:+ start:254 stop:436 length:183 start_codon:yes stop_codon:yes gene_type:complete